MNVNLKLSLDGKETDLESSSLYDIRDEIITTVYQTELQKVGIKTGAVRNTAIILGISEMSVWRVVENRNY